MSQFVWWHHECFQRSLKLWSDTICRKQLSKEIALNYMHVSSIKVQWKTALIKKISAKRWIMITNSIAIWSLQSKLVNANAVTWPHEDHMLPIYIDRSRRTTKIFMNKILLLILYKASHSPQTPYRIFPLQQARNELSFLQVYQEKYKPTQR